MYDLKRAINSGYDSLYTTAQDVLDKKMKELDKQIEIDAIKKANQAAREVIRESEKERKLKEKQRDYDAVVAGMASLILDSNIDTLGEEVVEKAKEKISNKKTRKTKSESKGEKVNEQEKVKRAGRPRKSA